MKTIPKINLEGARVLTPAEMNDIHLETGLHSPAPAAAASTTSAPRPRNAAG